MPVITTYHPPLKENIKYKEQYNILTCASRLVLFLCNEKKNHWLLRLAHRDASVIICTKIFYKPFSNLKSWTGQENITDGQIDRRTETITFFRYASGNYNVAYSY